MAGELQRDRLIARRPSNAGIPAAPLGRSPLASRPTRHTRPPNRAGNRTMPARVNPAGSALAVSAPWRFVVRRTVLAADRRCPPLDRGKFRCDASVPRRHAKTKRLSVLMCSARDTEAPRRQCRRLRLRQPISTTNAAKTVIVTVAWIRIPTFPGRVDVGRCHQHPLPALDVPLPADRRREEREKPVDPR